MTVPASPNPSPAIHLWQRRWATPALIAAAFIALLLWTWQRLADVLIDFGVQLYVPWQLSQGKVLYRDIAHYTGPLSVYYNALAFRTFGANLRVLELANLPILIGIVIAIHYVAHRLGGRLCAAVCALSFLILFAFAHISVAGNYNFLTPYEYEYTHATLLCLTCVIFLHRLILRSRPIDSAIAGFLAGMVFLTRAEFFLAIAGAAVVGFIFLALIPRRSFPTLAFIFLAAAALPPLISIGLLRLAMPWTTAIHGTLGMWPALLRGNVSAQHFYLHSMGLDHPQSGIRLLIVWTAVWSLPIAVFAGWAMIPKPNRAMPTLLIAFFLGTIFAGWQWRLRDWPSMFRPLPLLVVAVILISLIQHFRRPSLSQSPALAAMLGVLSLILLAKVFLYARIIHYGCWLAMPAAMLLVITLFGWIPATIHRRGGSAAAFYAGIAGAWTTVLIVHLAISGAAMKQLKVSVGNGADQFWADSLRGTRVNSAVLAAGQIPPGKTIDCFPEGIMINYLARRQTSTPFVNFNPPDLLLFGEDRMLQALNDSPPDFIFLVHKDTSEFGEKFFGRDYGQKLYAWVRTNYQVQDLPMLDLGGEPLRSDEFGIRLLIPKPPQEGQRRLIYMPGGAGTSASLAADSVSTAE